MKIIKALLTLGILAISVLTFAQKGGRNIYNWSLGGRYEYIGGVNSENQTTMLLGPTLKYLLDPQKDIEIMYLSDFSNGGNLYGIYQIFNPFPDIPQNFRYYMGAGLHAGRWKSMITANSKYIESGIDAQLGIEFIGKKIPLALSFDWHPEYNFMVEKEQVKFLLIKVGVVLKYYYKR